MQDLQCKTSYGYLVFIYTNERCIHDGSYMAYRRVLVVHGKTNRVVKAHKVSRDDVPRSKKVG